MGENIYSELPRVSSSNVNLSSLVARTGRHQQCYDCGYRLIAGCVPFRYKSGSTIKNDVHQRIEVMMVTTQGGPGLLFPKGGWETDETAEEAACRETYEEAGVRGDLKVGEVLFYPKKFATLFHHDAYFANSCRKFKACTSTLDDAHGTCAVHYLADVLTVKSTAQGCIGSWDFKSKRQQGHHSPDGLCRAYMFALVVKEELDFWPEQQSRQRQWITAEEAMEKCRYEWMQRVLQKCVTHLSSGQISSPSAALPNSHINSDPPASVDMIRF